MMGNEESHSSNFNLEKEAIEVTDNWSLHYANNVNGSANVRSAFISQQGSSDRSCGSLKCLAKNLMIHRHPCILQYVSSWNKNDSFYLITEEVKPLSQVIGNQSTLQICIGLHSILKALVFLHEKAQASHNNLCCAAIYVTPEGIWKLGGLNYLTKFSDITASYLQQSRAHRYEKAVPPEEDSLLPASKVNAEAIDQYAFGVLVEEILKKKSTDEIPFLMDFKSFCKKKLSCVDPCQRSKLSEIMSHQFFNHDFITIHKFLSELPLKLSHEKETFFRDLTVQLCQLPEEIVASQLTSLLLSRMVILDETAQTHLLPILLQPKTDERETNALFSEEIFKLYIIPKLLQMFCVRDSQVRFILLNNFRLFCNSFTMEQLRHQVLPELLLGIKDVDDQLVSTTLKALADLVLILGASTVIGGKRAKLFSDGRPKAYELISGSKSVQIKERTKISPIKNVNNHSIFENSELPERLSPDGGEDDISTTTVEEVDVDTENWSDWESPGEKENIERKEKSELEEKLNLVKETKIIPNEHRHSQHTLPDISTLDIKSNTGNSKGESRMDNESEIDFFRDMEPIISKTQSVDINLMKNKFDVNLEHDDIGEEWNDGWAIGDDNDSLVNFN